MKGWTNELPDESGPHWIVKQLYEDRELVRTSGPSIGYITIRQNTSEEIIEASIDWIGSDDPGGLPIASPMVLERRQPREPVFGWDSSEVADKKLRDAVNRKWVYWIRRIPDAVFSEKFPVTEYPETHQEGVLSIEKAFSTGEHHVDLGVQVAMDGRIWLCVNGEAYVRFKPISKATYETLYLAAVKAATVKEDE